MQLISRLVRVHIKIINQNSFFPYSDNHSTLRACLAAGDVTGNAKSAGDIMTSLLLRRHASTASHYDTHRFTQNDKSSKRTISSVHQVHLVEMLMIR